MEKHRRGWNAVIRALSRSGLGNVQTLLNASANLAVDSDGASALDLASLLHCLRLLGALLATTLDELGSESYKGSTLWVLLLNAILEGA